jgi:putative endonuclease
MCGCRDNRSLGPCDFCLVHGSEDRPLQASTTISPMPSPAPRRPSNPRWLVYLLRCSDGSLYTGITNDLPKRLKAHAAGKASRYTRSRLPVKLAYSEPQRSKSAALKREAAIKRLRRAEKDRLLAKR